jgi:hypothetical protein
VNQTNGRRQKQSGVDFDQFGTFATERKSPPGDPAQAAGTSQDRSGKR